MKKLLPLLKGHDVPEDMASLEDASQSLMNVLNVDKPLLMALLKPFHMKDFDLKELLFEILPENIIKAYDVGKMVTENITSRFKDRYRKLAMAKFMQVDFFKDFSKILKLTDGKNTFPIGIIKKIFDMKNYKYGM